MYGEQVEISIQVNFIFNFLVHPTIFVSRTIVSQLKPSHLKLIKTKKPTTLVIGPLISTSLVSNV